MDKNKLFTVCQEANCPNMGECWARGVATIMILGDTCTRACGFCNVKTGRPPVLDVDEPRRVARSLALMGLTHVVITSVNRDELPDGGAEIWAETIRRVHEACPGMSVECLVGDFLGDEQAIQTVCDARPEILSHNMETVHRMHPAVRPQAKYERSLAVLAQFKRSGLVTKTGIMVGIGERDDEVLTLMDDVRDGSRAQHDAVARIGTAIGQIEQVIHHAAAGAEQGSVAAEEMTAQAVALRDVVADLEAMVGSDREIEASMLFRS
jgi:lipoic acid synthetase